MMDKKQRKLVNELRGRGRATLTRIARAIQLPISTTFDRLRSLERDGTIRRFAALLDFTKAGFGARAVLLVRVAKPDKESLGRWLLGLPNTNTLLCVNNGWDFMVEVVFRDIRGLEGWLDGLESRFKVRTVQVHYVVEERCREGFRLPDD